MAGSAFDLDNFAPAALKINHRGTDWRLNGDPDVDVLARMLRIEEKIDETSKEGDINAIVAAVQEGKQLLIELILDIDPTQDASQFQANTQDVMTLFALVMHGGSVATAVAQALSRPTTLGDGDGDGVITAGSGTDETGADADATPLVSASSLLERSSTSDDSTAGDLVTGTA